MTINVISQSETYYVRQYHINTALISEFNLLSHSCKRAFQMKLYISNPPPSPPMALLF